MKQLFIDIHCVLKLKPKSIQNPTMAFSPQDSHVEPQYSYCALFDQLLPPLRGRLIM